MDGSGLLLGIITDRDITLKLVARGSSIPHAQVSDCMTSAEFACSADNSLESWVSAMSWHQVRRMPVVDDGYKVVGTISQTDLAVTCASILKRSSAARSLTFSWHSPFRIGALTLKRRCSGECQHPHTLALCRHPGATYGPSADSPTSAAAMPQYRCVRRVGEDKA